MFISHRLPTTPRQGRQKVAYKWEEEVSRNKLGLSHYAVNVLNIEHEQADDIAKKKNLFRSCLDV